MSAKTGKVRLRCPARRQLHRCFLRWLKENAARMQVPLVIESRTDRVIRCSFAGHTRALEMTLSHDIGIHVLHDGEWWDSLEFFEAWPIARHPGYICGFCKPEYQKTYPSRQALWEDHMFEPFLSWVNETLTTHAWLMLGQTDGGGILWAELHTKKKPNEIGHYRWIPLLPGTTSAVESGERTVCLELARRVE